MTVTITYFASLRDQSTVDKETLDIAQLTVSSLYEQLALTHSFSLPVRFVQFAVNGRFVSREHLLNDGDEVVFVPPVAGG